MISKELLSEILGEEVKEVYGEQSYMLCYLSSDIYAINIYELAHKCKMWAKKQGYWLYSSIDVCDIWEENINIKNVQETNEPEAIFKACEWIREQIGA